MKTKKHAHRSTSTANVHKMRIALIFDHQKRHSSIELECLFPVA